MPCPVALYCPSHGWKRPLERVVDRLNRLRRRPDTWYVHYLEEKTGARNCRRGVHPLMGCMRRARLALTRLEARELRALVGSS